MAKVTAPNQTLNNATLKLTSCGVRHQNILNCATKVLFEIWTSNERYFKMAHEINPCLINEEGEIFNPQRLQFSDKLIDEGFLQDLMDRSPQIIPIDSIDSSYGPLISLGREIDNIDNLFIAPNGRITIVEAKLWRNPQAIREVVAQILDYATRISCWSYEEFERRVQSKSRVNSSLYEYVCNNCDEELEPDSEAVFIDSVQASLSNGRFQLLIVGDGIRENLESMVDSLHTHPQKQFSFGLLELQVFRDSRLKDKFLVVPRLSLKTTEVIRGIVKIENTVEGGISVNVEQREEKSAVSKSKRINLTEQEFFEGLPDDQTREYCRNILTTLEDWGAVAGWRTAGVSVQLPAPEDPNTKFTLFVITISGEIYTGWLNEQLERSGRPGEISADLVGDICNLFPMVERHHLWVGSIKPNLEMKEVIKEVDQFLDIIQRCIQKIRGSS